MKLRINDLILASFIFLLPVAGGTVPMSYGYVCTNCPSCGICSDAGCPGMSPAAKNAICIAAGCGAGFQFVDPAPIIPGVCAFTR